MDFGTEYKFLILSDLGMNIECIMNIIKLNIVLAYLSDDFFRV